MKIKTKRGPRRMRNQRVVPRPKFDEGDLKLYEQIKGVYRKIWRGL